MQTPPIYLDNIVSLMGAVLVAVLVFWVVVKSIKLMRS